MTLHEFIFTNKRPERYLRHITFWVGQCVFWIFWATGFFVEISLWNYIEWNFKNHCYFIFDICYTYFVVYYLTPKYLITQKYFKFGISIFILTVFTYALFVFYLFWLNDTTNLPKTEQLRFTWFFTMHFIFSGPLTICAMFLTSKMLKNYYAKMEEKSTLIKETSNAELQLLKAQIHPHFLFNTLNNIYSFNLNKSPQTAGLVIKLSDTLKYMINDCQAELVPVEKEIKMIQDYMGLEKVRYGERLTMDTEINGDYQNQLIAPLLLIPFVENCFKHGTSKMLEHPWLKMHILIQIGTLHFKISNSNPPIHVPSTGVKGIGLKNVQKRLQLLYPGEHHLEINADEHFYHVELRVPLHEIRPKEPPSTKPEIPSSEIYANQ